MATLSSKRLIGMLLIGIVTLHGVSGSWAAVLNVCQSGCAYGTIQSAIDAAAAGDTVLVHDGIYAERINFLGKAITVGSVNGPTDTRIDGSGGGSVVTFNWGEGSGSVLRGFRITNGRAEHGGGIFCNGASPSIVNCAIDGNAATGSGGGIYCLNSSTPMISGCSISSNSATLYGGGIACQDHSSPAIVGCTILLNSTGSGSGGAINCNYYSSPSISRCVISQNSAGTCGGGVACSSYSSPAVDNCFMSWNRAATTGGGIYCSAYSAPRITNCTIRGNSVATYGGGGVGCTGYSTPVLVNCTIIGNAAVTGGGGISGTGFSSPRIVNCTLSGNSSGGSGGGIHLQSSDPVTVVNSILWGNHAPSAPEVSESGAAIDISSSDVQGGWFGTGNIDADPLFLDPHPAAEAPTLEGDYHLAAGSPCVNSGQGNDATHHGFPAYDIDGDPRPQGAGYDMGSDEFALLANGSFEESYWRIPEHWNTWRQSLDGKDGRAFGVARGGRTSFRMTGAPANKQLRQTIVLSGPAGDIFDLSCWHKAYGTSLSGGFFGVKLMISHTDGTKRTCNLGFLKRNHNWRESAASFHAPKPYTSVKVALVYASQTGRAWFDDVKLSVRKP